MLPLRTFWPLTELGIVTNPTEPCRRTTLKFNGEPLEPVPRLAEPANVPVTGWIGTAVNEPATGLQPVFALVAP
jgi:hypothetical protein